MNKLKIKLTEFLRLNTVKQRKFRVNNYPRRCTKYLIAKKICEKLRRNQSYAIRLACSLISKEESFF